MNFDVFCSSRYQVQAEMKKILFILHMPPPVHGAAMVGKYIHDSEVINSEFDCNYINLTTADSLEDIGKVGMRKLTAFVRLLVKIKRAVTEQKPNLVYITPNSAGGAFYKDFVVVMILKRMGCKVVVHFHNKGVSKRQERMFDDLLYKRFFKGIKVILLGASLYKDVEKYVKKEDFYICPNGIPPMNFHYKQNDSPFKGLNEVPRLLFLSNLIESKGVIVLLDALKILQDKGVSFVCDFVGGETAEMDAKRFNVEVEKRGLGEKAVYKGKKHGTDKLMEYGRTDIFVFPTYYSNECFPLVLLEAMEQGIPCVTTNEGAICNIIDDGANGFIVKRKDVHSLVDKIETLLTDKELRTRMGENGRDKFRKEFTLEVFERKFVEILTRVLKDS